MSNPNLVCSASSHQKAVAGGAQRSMANSRGRPIAPSPTGLEAFWRFFGNSKATDEQGRPLVLFHGTCYEFGVFTPSEDGGIYMTDSPWEAEEFGHLSILSADARVSIMPLYASIQNPKRLDMKGREFNDAMRNRFTKEIAAAKACGRDGLIVRNVDNFGAGASDTFIAFSSTQIKSVTGNPGSYDEGNAHITDEWEAIQNPVSAP